MKKSIAAISLVFTAFSFADFPHVVPAANCPAGQICCPQALYCSYLNGCGDSGMWKIYGAPAQFDGVKEFLPHLIMALSYVNNEYQAAYCSYGQNGEINLQANSSYSLFGSDWEYSFMKEEARCSSTNPLDCTFTPAG